MRRHLLLHLLGALALGVLTVTAPASADTPPPGDIPDNQAFVTFHGAGYSIKVPDGWTRTTRAGTTSFVDKYNGISVTIVRRASAPTVANVTRSELAHLKATIAGFTKPVLTGVSRPAGAGVLLTYEASSARSSVTGKRITNDFERYELWRAGTLAVVTLGAPHGSDNVDAWKLVTTSLRWTR